MERIAERGGVAVPQRSPVSVQGENGEVALYDGPKGMADAFESRGRLL